MKRIKYRYHKAGSYRGNRQIKMKQIKESQMLSFRERRWINYKTTRLAIRTDERQQTKSSQLKKIYMTSQNWYNADNSQASTMCLLFCFSFVFFLIRSAVMLHSFIIFTWFSKLPNFVKRLSYLGRKTFYIHGKKNMLKNSTIAMGII